MRVATGAVARHAPRGVELLTRIVARACWLGTCRDSIRDPGMARMTYDGRDEWAAAREHLLTNPVNARSLRTIEK